MFSVALFGVWILLGWDSGVGMIEYAIYGLPDLITGAISLQEWLAIPSFLYGKTMHFSAFVIYGLLYVGLSKYYASIGIKNSKNVAYSLAFSFLSIAIFEYFWIYSFSYFQNQSWVSTWVWPQLRILLQNAYLLLVGVLAILYIYADGYKLRLNWRTLLIFGITFASCIFWIYYPLPVEQITLTLTTGTWRSSLNFPQTLYTIDCNPLDGDNSGIWFYVQNDLLHGINLLVKVLLTYCCYYLFKIIPPSNVKHEEEL